jgi:hypothetical protein
MTRNLGSEEIGHFGTGSDLFLRCQSSGQDTESERGFSMQNGFSAASMASMFPTTVFATRLRASATTEGKAGDVASREYGMSVPVGVTWSRCPPEIAFVVECMEYMAPQEVADCSICAGHSRLLGGSGLSPCYFASALAS